MTILEILTFKDSIKTLKNNLSEHNQHLNTGLHSDYTHHHDHKSFHLHLWAAFFDLSGKVGFVNRTCCQGSKCWRFTINANSSPTQFKIHFIKFQLCKSACCDVANDTDTQPGNRPTDWVGSFLSPFKDVEGTAKNQFQQLSFLEGSRRAECIIWWSSLVSRIINPASALQ